MDVSELSESETTNSELPCSVRTGTIFGAVVGLIAGPVVGASICLMSGQWDSMPYGILLGMLLGPFPGAFIGNVERTLRKEHTQPFVGTAVCIAFGIASVAAFIGLPLLWAIVGALFDRGFDEYRRQSFPAAILFGGFGIAACASCTYLIDTAAYGPSPDEIRWDVVSVIESSRHYASTDVDVEILSLEREGRRTYIGTAKASHDGQESLLILNVEDSSALVSVTWTEQPFPDAEEQ